MPCSNLNDRIAISLFFIWLGATAFAFYWFSDAKLVKFDPDGLLNTVLESQSSKLAYEQALKSELRQTYGSLANSAFNISQSNCSCNQLLNTHLQTLNPWLEQKGFFIHNVNYTGIKSYVPSSPAIIVFDENESLIYVGPYSTGYLCNSENGIVELAINSAISFKGIPAMILSDAQGCYCHT